VLDETFVLEQTFVERSIARRRRHRRHRAGLEFCRLLNIHHDASHGHHQARTGSQQAAPACNTVTCIRSESSRAISKTIAIAIGAEFAPFMRGAASHVPSARL